MSWKRHQQEKERFMKRFFHDVRSRGEGKSPHGTAQTGGERMLWPQVSMTGTGVPAPQQAGLWTQN